MKKKVLTAVLLACLMALNLALVSCGGGKSALIGKWIPIEGEFDEPMDWYIAESIGFTKDGKGDVDGDDLTWSTEKDQLKLDVYGGSYSLGYKISGSTLTLTSEDGQVVKLKKE